LFYFVTHADAQAFVERFCCGVWVAGEWPHGGKAVTEESDMRWVGDPAQDVMIGRRDQPIDVFDPGQLYIVDSGVLLRRCWLERPSTQKGPPMPDQIDAAIKAYYDRRGREQNAETERQAQVQGQIQAKRRLMDQWAVTTTATIAGGVQNANNEFARRQPPSPFHFVGVPARQGTLEFEIRRSGQTNRVGAMQFVCDFDAGTVTPHSTVSKLPGGIPFDAATMSWAQNVATMVMRTALGSY
jgi:hypothetical protein